MGKGVRAKLVRRSAALQLSGPRSLSPAIRRLCMPSSFIRIPIQRMSLPFIMEAPAAPRALS